MRIQSLGGRICGSGLPLLPFALMIAACTVKLISDYDEALDRAASDLQIKVEAFLVKMQASAGTPDGEYAKNSTFYDEVKVALSAMRLRAEATPKNELTVEQIGLLEKNLENLRQLHESAGPAGLSKTVVATTRTLLNTQFKAILTLELAKKRGQR